MSRLATGLPRPGSPSIARRGGIPRPGSPAGVSRLARPTSPPSSPLHQASPPIRSQLARPGSPARQQTLGAGPSSPTRPRTLPTSKLAAPRVRSPPSSPPIPTREILPTRERTPSPDLPSLNGHYQSSLLEPQVLDERNNQDEITITISSILSGDPSRSVDALKKIQRILEIAPGSQRTSLEFQNLANHTDGLIETVTLQMAHVFDRPDGVADASNYRLAKHLIQTLNAFCDHTVLAETLPVDILTSLLEELTMRLLQTDESPDSRVKDLSRFINMIILRLFAVGRRIHVFRWVIKLLLKGISADRT